MGAIVINNKISNVGVQSGLHDARAICDTVSTLLELPKTVGILPSSTGVIGWQLPLCDMTSNLKELHDGLQKTSILPAAMGILTTDLYPKIRSAQLGGGSIVGIAKGAGMIEPNMATMLVFLVTDLDVPQPFLKSALQRAVDVSFNTISIDSDTSTSDTVVLVSSGKVPVHSDAQLVEFEHHLTEICTQLAQDVVRNGEGTKHVIACTVCNAPSAKLAASIGKSIVNSPLFKCAVAGNDPNVGRLIMAIGKEVGRSSEVTYHDPLAFTTITMGGYTIFEKGYFTCNATLEAKLVAHMKEAELYSTTPTCFPPHEKSVDITVDVGAQHWPSATNVYSTTITGSDLTHDYVSINADYRS